MNKQSKIVYSYLSNKRRCPPTNFQEKNPAYPLLLKLTRLLNLMKNSQSTKDTKSKEIQKNDFLMTFLIIFTVD